MNCFLLAAVIACAGGMPKLTAAEAAAVLAPHQFVYVALAPPRPAVVVIPSSATAGPFGEFKRQDFCCRLDGTPLWWPPTVYGGVRLHHWYPAQSVRRFGERPRR